ncbi:hypothetical protein BHM03_00045852 [Ensete ventricosum]|nr:hypothetical protein BHM03_00045852 [Ensete ventricosum]
MGPHRLLTVLLGLLAAVSNSKTGNECSRGDNRSLCSSTAVLSAAPNLSRWGRIAVFLVPHGLRLTPLNPELCSPVTPSHPRREKALEQEPEILLGCAAALPLFPQPLTVGAPLPVRPLHQGQDSLQRPPPPPAAAPLVLLCRGAASESAADREGGHGNPLDHGNSPPLVLVKGVTEILLIAHVSAPLVSGRNWSVDGSCGAGYEW